MNDLVFEMNGRSLRDLIRHVIAAGLLWKLSWKDVSFFVIFVSFVVKCSWP
jgi:hypothetical protein